MKCVDLGSEYCPCRLALTGDCLICSRLQSSGVFGEDCDCQWSGSCPYTVLAQNGGCVGDVRREEPAALVKRTDYEEGVSVLVLKAGRGFAQKASLPGSFVFLRREKTGEHVLSAEDSSAGRYLETPISVMKVEEHQGTIHLAIRREGPKSKLLLNRALPIGDEFKGESPERLKTEESFWIRGPYHSGLLGAEALKPGNVKGKNVLFLTKGIGAAPALLTLDRFMTMDQTPAKTAKIRWLADDTKIDREMIEEYVRMLGKDRMPGCQTVKPEYTLLAGSSGARERELPESVIREGYDVVVVAGSPYFVETMCREVRTHLPDAFLVVSNNVKMCCGEGICGACTETVEDGRVIRWCKCQ